MSSESDTDKTQSFVPLTNGTMVSHYRIVRQIGAGGMGEVYLAEDTKLDRKVALKFLPLHLCQNEECRARFTREAQAAAKLDHPNIISVFEVGEYLGRPFFSMQLVEGQTLREVIAEKSLPLERILEIGIQVCEGLQAAHEKGITHRDIKPSNILIDSHGRVRIVDFGLASVMGLDHLTKTGSTLGTVGYMSPEQVQGQQVDHRTDLFSVGVVLYELITGHAPFKAESEAATLRAITDSKPELLARFRREVPDELQMIIDKAMEKSVTTRYQHADEMAADLVRSTHAMSASTGAVSPRSAASRSRAVFYLVAALVVVVAGAAALYFLRYEGAERRTVAPEFKKITKTGDAYYGVISPDGTSYAYSRITSASGIELTVYVSDFSGGQAIPVFEAAWAQSICWSPDGKELLIRGVEKGDTSTQAVYLIPRLGGKARRYAVPGALTGRGWDIAWLPDGTRFASLCDDRLLLVERKNADTAAIPFGRRFNIAMIGAFSPDGRWLAFCGTTDSLSGLWLCDLQKEVTSYQLAVEPTIAMAWSETGKALYVVRETVAQNSGQLLRLAFDQGSGKVQGEPEVLLSGMPSTLGLSISQDGRRLLCRQFSTISNLRKVTIHAGMDPTAQPAVSLTSGTQCYLYPEISPDGRFVSYLDVVDGLHQVFVSSVDGGEATQVTDLTEWINAECWSPDGKQLAVIAFDSSLINWNLWLVDISGTASPKVLATGPAALSVGLLNWSTPDRIIVNYNADSVLFVDAHTGESSWQKFASLDGRISFPEMSPDGTRMALFPQGEILVYTLADSSLEQLGKIEAYPLGWGRDGEWLYYLFGSGIVARINVRSRAIDTLAVLSDLDWVSFTNGVAIAPDGSFVIHEVRRVYRDLYLIENFDPYVR